ncbi:hypothetical protein [Sciscionella sediminilitoris]|uniref:hypothetical protein n=1 Tax=Sciscionella sediminilitoris TaxID=1445613 RepID=UPI0004DFC01D|nr:hypothetical protein [Sciscionella sp. SE31]
MSTTAETGHVTGTADKDYNIIWFVENCLSNALRLESYVQDAERAEDAELAGFFRRAQQESQKGAEQGKQLLAHRITS